MYDATGLTDVFEPEVIEPQSEKAQRRQKRKMEKEDRQKRRSPKPVEPRTKNQAIYKQSLEENFLTFGIGPAGTGKTYFPARLYGQMLAMGVKKKLYLARPNVSKSKHKNGFLPGDLKEKTEPWLIPIFDGLKDAMGPSEFKRLKEEGAFEEVPYEYIQGRTLKDAFCIVDEAENLDLDDLYITLTRQGENLHMVLCGDIYQSVIRDSGLGTVVEMARGMDDVGVVRFTDDDVVRSPMAKQWVKAFQNLWTNEHKGFSEETTPNFMRQNWN